VKSSSRSSKWMMDLIVGSFDIPVMQVYKSKSSDKNESKWEHFAIKRFNRWTSEEHDLKFWNFNIRIQN
jgi:hypothetical protein